MTKLLVTLCEVMIELPHLCFSADLTDSCALNDCMLNGQREGLMVNVAGLYVKKKKPLRLLNSVGLFLI